MSGGEGKGVFGELLRRNGMEWNGLECREEEEGEGP